VEIFCRDAMNADFEHVILFDTNLYIGFAISAPSLGNYRIEYNLTDGSSHGSLMHDGIPDFGVSDSGDAFCTNREMTDEGAICSVETGEFTLGLFEWSYHTKQIVRAAIGTFWFSF
jgi:hypothetical protein